MQKMSAELEKYDPIKQRLNAIMEAGLQFHEWLWTEDPELREKWRAYRHEHPKEYAARERSFNLFFGKIVPSRALIQHQSDGGKVKIKAEQIEALNLSPFQLKKLAGLLDIESKDEKEECENAVIVKEG